MTGQLDGTGWTDEAFLADLAASAESVEVVARWLTGLGYPVVIRSTAVDPHRVLKTPWDDGGDLEILQRVEVKQRKSLVFTSKEDFPYPTVIVDDAASYRRKQPRPYAYVIVNHALTCALVVYCRTEKRWTTSQRFDRKIGRTCSFLECPLELTALADFT